MSRNGKTHEVYVRLRSRTTGQPLTSTELRPRLVADARDRGTNVTAVIVEILAAHYRMNVKPISAKATNAAEDVSEFPVFLPVALAQKIRSSLKLGETMQRRITGILCAHYGLADRPAETTAA